jgi:tetratricopeptide (TPR) repeat protein
MPTTHATSEVMYSSAELAALLPPGWSLDFPLVRVRTCGTLVIEVLQDLHPGAGGRMQAVYGPPAAELFHIKGMTTALLLLALLASQPGGFASKDLLTQTLPHLRRGNVSNEEDDLEEDSSLARLDNVVSLLRKLLCPPKLLTFPGTHKLRKRLVSLVRATPDSGLGYRLAEFPLLWLDVEAMETYVTRARRLDEQGEDGLEDWQAAYQIGMRGSFLSHEPYSEWADWRRGRVADLLWQSVNAQCHRAASWEVGTSGIEAAVRLLLEFWQAQVTNQDAFRALVDLLGKQERFQLAEECYRQLCAALDREGRLPHPRTQEAMEVLRATRLRREVRRPQPALASSASGSRVAEGADAHSDEETSQEGQSEVLAERIIAETRHLIGREAWLAAVRQMVQAFPAKKLIVLQGPIGIGKSSELTRLASQFQRDERSFHVIWLPFSAAEWTSSPEVALDVLLATLLSACGVAPMPSEVPRERLMAAFLAHLKQHSRPIVILLDNAECLLDEKGMLAPCWEAFLTQFVRSRHQASLLLATKEWHGWSGRESVFVAETLVPPLSPDESVRLLQDLGLEELAVEQLQAVGMRMAGIPLLLEWTAKLLADPLLLNDWSGFDERDGLLHAHTTQASRARRLRRLLDDPALLGSHLAARLTPLLEYIMDKHLSPEARRVLERLAVATIPLGKAALEVLCPRPALLKELRDASLLAAYTNRVQLLPMVAETVRQQLTPEQRREAEELVIQAYKQWLDEGNLEIGEAGNIVTELAVLLLAQHLLLEAAELLTRCGWLSFKLGNAPRIAHLVEQVMEQFDWQASLEHWCSGTLLRYRLMQFLGKKFPVQQRLDDYLAIREAIFTYKIVVEPNVLIAITHYIISCAMDHLRFEEAWSELEAASRYLGSLQGVNVDLAASLLIKRALIRSIWCSYLEEQGEQDAADQMQEEALVLYQQCRHLLETYHEPNPLKRAKLKKRLAYVLNFLGYHLYRKRRYEEAIEALYQSAALQEQGFGEIDGLAPCYSDLSQTLAAMGRFREALHFDEKASKEAERLAEAGHTSAQKEVWVYRISRGCLYLRLGRIDEAEMLLGEALPHIAAHRRMYRMFAKNALEEIEQWKRSVITPQHQLDWRWVERYRTLASFDSYWWLAPAGPFTDEEQREWEQWFARDLDEATKVRLGVLMASSTRREIRAALDEQREPRLQYPALDIEEVHARIGGLLQLDALVLQDEPNAIVRRLYHDTIEEELHFLHLIQATYERDNKHFWEQNLCINPLPTPEEMYYVFSRVRHYVLQSLLHPRAKEAGEQFLHICKECGLTFELAATEEKQEIPHPIVSLAPSQQHTRAISAQATKHFFEAVFQKTDFTGWQVAFDPNADSARVEQGLRCLFLPNRSFSLQEIRQLLAHELAGHVARCMAGERSLLGLLGIHSKNSLETEEGLGMYYEILDAKREGRDLDETGIWLGTLATGLASGVLTPPQTFSSLYRFFVAFLTMYRLLVRPDQDAETARRNARRLARERCLRTFRGMPQLMQAGICYTKDAHYLRGLRKVEEACKEDEQVLQRLAVGVVALDRLSDLHELGITTAPRHLRQLVEDPRLDEYIIAFEQEEGKEEKSF